MKKEKLDIIYEDKYLIVINKKSGLLTIASPKEKEKTLYHQVSDYVKKQHKSNKIFIVHRLDKDTSGLVLFAKSSETKNKLQNNWFNSIRKYYAIVEDRLEKKEQTLKSYIAETQTLFSYSTNDSNKGKLALTHYKVIKEAKQYSLLDIHILTGRKNQIRVQLSDIGNPIVGDKKYNSKKNPLRRLCLHAYYLEFMHPITNQNLILKTPLPKSFEMLITN